MILFVKVAFWIFLLDTVGRLLSLAILPYPREMKRGYDAFNLALNGIFAVWAWYVVWGV